MYKDGLIANIKVGGKILREVKDVVYLPFGTEYTIFIKNITDRRASVTINVDGTNVGDGSDFIVPANSQIEIKRFINKLSNTEGNAFKFVERTDKIEEFRGIKPEDGLVRLNFRFEARGHVQPARPIFPYDITKYDFPGYPNKQPWNTNPWQPGSSSPDWYTYSSTTTVLRGIRGEAQSTLAHSTSLGTNDTGITVPGSAISQEFNTVARFATDPSSAGIIVLRLVGQVEEIKVEKPVTVKKQLRCRTCGTVNKYSAKFCTECGTSLTIY